MSFFEICCSLPIDLLVLDSILLQPILQKAATVIFPKVILIIHHAFSPQTNHYQLQDKVPAFSKAYDQLFFFLSLKYFSNFFSSSTYLPFSAHKLKHFHSKPYTFSFLCFHIYCSFSLNQAVGIFSCQTAFTSVYLDSWPFSVFSTLFFYNIYMILSY
jgi:hypothetical protein